MKIHINKKMVCLCFLLCLSALLMIGCSIQPSEKDITTIVTEYENLPSTAALSIEKVEKNDNSYDATVSIRYNYETYETIQTKTYTLDFEDNSWSVNRVHANDQKSSYPLIGSDITKDAIAYYMYNYKYIVEGSEEPLYIPDLTFTETNRTTSIEKSPYSESIVYKIETDSGYINGTGSIEVDMDFSESACRWQIDSVKQLEPMVFKWNEGKEFTFNDSDFLDYIDSSFTKLTFTSDDGVDEVSLDEDDSFIINLQQQPKPIFSSTCEAIIDIDATNHVYNIKAKLRCLYTNDGGNAWSIKDVEVISGSIEKPELIGTWEGYLYFEDKLNTHATKHNMRIVFDEYIESNGEYSGTAYIFSNESFNDDKLLLSYKIRADYQDSKNCFYFNNGEIISGDDRFDFEFKYSFSDKITMNGEILGINGYKGDINESVLNKIN